MKKFLITATALLAIVVFTACPTGHGVALQWSSVTTGHIGNQIVTISCNYKVYRSLANDSGYTLLGNTGLTTYLDSTVSSASTYFYRVTAVDKQSGKEGPPSNQVSILIP